MAYERIDCSKQFDGKTRDSHEIRYHFAAGFVEDFDVVIDAGCGVGYGRDILEREHVEYYGLDKNPPDMSEFIKVNFEQGSVVFEEVYGAEVKYRKPKPFDVFVGLEIIEHLDPYKYFVEFAKKAEKWIIISTPIIPNSNPFHKQQFTEQQVIDLFVDEQWRLYGNMVQNNMYGFFVFKRI